MAFLGHSNAYALPCDRSCAASSRCSSFSSIPRLVRAVNQDADVLSLDGRKPLLYHQILFTSTEVTQTNTTHSPMTPHHGITISSISISVIPGIRIHRRGMSSVVRTTPHHLRTDLDLPGVHCRHTQIANSFSLAGRRVHCLMLCSKTTTTPRC